MEGTGESEQYDVEYEMTLDEPLTLELAGKRGPLAAGRVTDWEVEGIASAADVEFSEDEVKRPDKAYLNYCDEDRVLYVSNPVPNREESFYYLVMYRCQESGQEMGESPVSYMGMLYEISGDEIVAVISRGVGHPDLLYRMKTDGGGCEKIGQMPKE